MRLVLESFVRATAVLVFFAIMPVVADEGVLYRPVRKRLAKVKGLYRLDGNAGT